VGDAVEDIGAGWLARLELGYARQGTRTVPVHRRHLGPLRVQKHFEPEPGLCEHILVHPPGGIAGGDQLGIAVSLEAGADVRLTTPGATKWYRGAGRRASQQITASLAEGAALELLPHEHVVFDGADASSRLSVSLSKGARFIGWELVALGRAAGEQPLLTGCWRSALDVTIEGRLALDEQLVLAADSPLRRSPLGLQGQDAMGTAVFCGFISEIEISRLDTLRAMASGPSEDLSTGLTQLPGLLVARAIGTNTDIIFRWFVDLWHNLSPTLLGRAARPPRIWRT
jgi:urease accessory protein